MVFLDSKWVVDITSFSCPVKQYRMKEYSQRSGYKDYCGQSIQTQVSSTLVTSKNIYANT